MSQNLFYLFVVALKNGHLGKVQSEIILFLCFN